MTVSGPKVTASCRWTPMPPMLVARLGCRMSMSKIRSKYKRLQSTTSEVDDSKRVPWWIPGALQFFLAWKHLPSMMVRIMRMMFKLLFYDCFMLFSSMTTTIRVIVTMTTATWCHMNEGNDCDDDKHGSWHMIFLDIPCPWLAVGAAASWAAEILPSSPFSTSMCDPCCKIVTVFT